MKYISEINAFYDLLAINTSLTHSSIVLWHALMQIANRCGWQESFTVAISTLEGKTLLNKQAVIRARNQLQQSGLISFESRKGNLSAIYKINSLCDKMTYCFDTQDDTQSDTQSDTQDDTQSDTINRLDKTRLDKEMNKEIFDCYQDTFGFMSSSVNSEISCYLKNGVSVDVIIDAIKKAKSNNASSWSYAKAIINKPKGKAVGYDYSDKEGSL